MSVPHVPVGDLAGVLPELMARASVIALIPAEGAAGSAPQTAWTVARAAAALGRRTLLVDCFVDAPRLHAVVGASSDDGIVDAFEYGASLNRLARPQLEANLFFIPSGTYAPDAGRLMAHPRWQRLAAGFRHEGALLLLFLPADALPVIAREADGTIVLAPEGFAFDADAPPILAALAARGTPVLVATAGGGAAPTAAAAPEPDAVPAPERPALRPSRAPFAELAAVRAGGPKRTRRAVVYAGVVVVAGTLGVIAVRPEWVLPTAQAPEPAAAAPTPTRQVDTLGWIVQVSAWDNLGRALQAADTLVTLGIPIIVSPTRLPRRVSFRVQAGPFRSQAAADSVLDSLRARRLADPIGSASVELPLSVAIAGGAASADTAGMWRDSLRAQGVPSFLLGQRDGRLRLFAGAFDGEATAAYLDSLLLTLGRAHRLAPRVGYVP